jgi:uncharacterized protein
MGNFFLLIYKLLKNRRILFFSAVFVSGLVIVFLASKINLEEDISKSIPGENDKTGFILNHSRFTNKIILNIFLKDTLQPADPGKLIAFADAVTDSLGRKEFQNFIDQRNFKIDDSQIEDMMQFFSQNLPIFLDSRDYQKIDSLILPETIEKTVEKNYKTLISPASFALKKYILQDPVGINSLVLVKLKQFQIEEGYEITDGYIFTRNKRNLLLFLNPVNAPSETLQNSIFFDKLDALLGSLSTIAGNEVRADYYGAAAVAVGNAQQIKKDIAVTITLALIIILSFVGWYFRKATVPFISFLPGLFGGGFALALIYLFRGSISTIALGIGSVLLGIIVDYALYIYSLYKSNGSVEKVVKDMGISIPMCSITTTIAFFSLLFVKSEVLRDLGLFAGLSILGAAFFSLVILPHLLKPSHRPSEVSSMTIVDRIAAYPFESKWFLLAFILVITVVSLFYYRKAAFENDMNTMNFLSKKMKEAERNLNAVSDISLKSIYVFSTGKDLEQALATNDIIAGTLDNLKTKGIIKKYSDVGTLLINDSIQQLRIKQWEDYWTPEKKIILQQSLDAAGRQYGFKKGAFASFYTQLEKKFQSLNPEAFEAVRNLFLNDMITETKDVSLVMSIVKVNPENRHNVYTSLSAEKNAIVIDRQESTSKLVKGVKFDFDLLVNLCLIFVTLTLIISFGRLETGIIASIPMFISWLWTLGFMGLTGVKFNIINIIVSTFVFGLGVDYSILMMRAMLLEYKTGYRDMTSYKTSIFLSSFTTLVGVGVLILAKHPSLNSIALIAIIGLLSVVLISYTLEPVLFRWLVYKKGKSRVMPITISDFLMTLVVGFFFIPEFIFLMLLRILILPLPISRVKKKRIVHIGFSHSLKFLAYIPFNIRKRTINESHEDFRKPAVVVCNHKSHLDVPSIMKISPNLIVLTARWVWNNPIFAPTIRYLDYYPINDGYEAIMDKLQKKVSEGYSILVFPEGTRSPDSHIKRFHKGAFLLAERLNLDIVPIIIHGSKDCLTKGENHIKSGSITVTIFPRLKAEDKSFGSDYHERTRYFQRFFREQYQRLQTELETPAYFRKRLVRNYIYKGPVLEWYTRIKLSLEKNYAWFHNQIPHDAFIVDIGCGYGMMSYMLNFTSDKRTILGIDYDQNKIEVASHCISKNERIQFVAADAVTYDYPRADVFILSDVLHYLPEEKQEYLLIRCLQQLNHGGQIIIRDGDRDLKKRHRGTRLTEFFSVNFGFNKALHKKLFFFSGKKIIEIANQHGMDVQIVDDTRLTSNLIYVIKHK